MSERFSSQSGQIVHVHLFLDNDDSGDKAHARFTEAVGAGVVDERIQYEGSKDVNKYLQSQGPPDNRFHAMEKSPTL